MDQREVFARSSRVTGSHAHLHEHKSNVHLHWHSHGPEREHHGESLAPPEWLNGAPSRLGIFHTLRPLFVGLVHGLAGSAALRYWSSAPSANPAGPCSTLMIFGVGTIAGMMLITAAIALPFSFAGYKFAWLNKGLIVGSGLLSLAFGLFVCYQIGFVDGLFTKSSGMDSQLTHGRPRLQKPTSALGALRHGFFDREINGQKFQQAGNLHHGSALLGQCRQR